MGNKIWSFSLYSIYLGMSWNLMSAVLKFSQESVGVLAGLLKDVKKWESSWTKAWTNSSKYLRWSRWEKIFVKYLPREGLVCQFFCFLLFFSARSNCSVHKISDLTNQPFMAFSNNSTNIQIIFQKIRRAKFWRFWTIEGFWIKFEHVTRF